MTIPPPPTTTSGSAAAISTAGLLAGTESRIRADLASIAMRVEQAADRLWGTYGLSAIALLISAIALIRSCK